MLQAWVMFNLGDNQFLRFTLVFNNCRILTSFKNIFHSFFSIFFSIFQPILQKCFEKTVKLKNIKLKSEIKLKFQLILMTFCKSFQPLGINFTFIVGIYKKKNKMLQQFAWCPQNISFATRRTIAWNVIVWFSGLTKGHVDLFLCYFMFQPL